MVTLECTNGYADVPATFISKQIISNFDSFPIDFELRGNRLEADKITHCDIGVDVRREPKKICIGDLTNEYYNVIDIPAKDVDVMVTGLEPCGTPQSGGFCL